MVASECRLHTQSVLFQPLTVSRLPVVPLLRVVPAVAEAAAALATGGAAADASVAGASEATPSMLIGASSPGTSLSIIIGTSSLL